VEIADLLCDKVLRAKQLFDHSRRTLTSDRDIRNASESGLEEYEEE